MCFGAGKLYWNRRFLRLSDTILFEDNQLKLDVIPEAFIRRNIDYIYNYAYGCSDNLLIECEINDIIPEIVTDERQLAEDIGRKYNVNITTLAEANKIVKD